MYPSSWLACVPFLAAVILAAAPPPSILQSRQEAPSSPPAGSPGIFAKVSSPNGTDLTSNFQVLVYHHDSHAPSNLTDRSLEDRQVLGSYRAIVSCQNPDGQFQTSVCDHYANRRTSLQRWIVECRVLGGRNGRMYRRVLEGGSCHAGEICVNGPRSANGWATFASCVRQDAFQPIPNYDTAEGLARYRAYLLSRWGGAYSTLVMSAPDKMTPIKVQSLELEAGIAGVGHAGGEVGPTSEGKCENCVELETGNLKKGTDYLMAEATVAGSLGAAAAGILWLTVMG